MTLDTRLEERGSAPRGAPLPLALLRGAVPLHFTLKFKGRHGRIFWKGAKMKLRRRGSVWKEQMDYFFLSWRMRSAPGYPSSWTPPKSACALEWWVDT